MKKKKTRTARTRPRARCRSGAWRPRGAGLGRAGTLGAVVGGIGAGCAVAVSPRLSLLQSSARVHRYVGVHVHTNVNATANASESENASAEVAVDASANVSGDGVQNGGEIYASANEREDHQAWSMPPAEDPNPTLSLFP